MKNDARNRATNRPVAVSLHCYLLVCFGAQTLMPLAAFADTGLPPPAVHQTTQNSFPSSQALQRQGYDPSRGVLRVKDTNQGRPTVTSNGGTITGTQSKAVTVTGKYGEKATIQTATTQKVGSSALSKGIAAAYVLDAAQNSEAGQYAGLARENFKKGDYVSSVHNIIKSAGAVVDRMAGGAFTQAGIALGQFAGTLPSSNNDAALKRIFDRAKQDQDAAEKRGDFAGATVNAAVKKAAETATNTSQQEERNRQEAENKAYAVMIGYFINGKWSESESLGVYGDNLDTRQWAMAYYDKDGKISRYDGFSGSYDAETTARYEYLQSLLPQKAEPYSAARIYVERITPQNKEKVVKPGLNKTVDPTLTGSEVEAILKRMLESQQTNHEELMKQLAKMGDAVEKATTSQEWTAKTATTEPYTPAGSDTPQQTRFTIDKNGNITATTIPRPDLKPHSSQAPTRTAVIKNPNAENAQQQNQQTNQDGQTTNQTGQQQNQTGQQTGQTGQTTTTTGQNAQQQSQQQQQQNFCQQNPRAAACAELGETDYEDLEIPENVIDLNFEPADIFQTQGVCPQPKIVNLGVFGTVEFSYQQICDFAFLLRPVLIAATIMMCAWFVFESVREL